MADKEQMLAAMNSALSGETPPPETPPAGDETPPAGDETPAGGEAPAGGETPAGGEAPAGDETPPAGDETPPEGEETPPEGEQPAGDGKDGKKPGDKKEGDGKDKKPDHLNDPMPEGLHERTRERITSLVGMVKDRDARITEQQELFDRVADTGVTPENFAQTLQVLRLFNSESIDDKRLAYKFLLQQAQQLAPLIGETLPGDDPLAGHDDLREAVAANSITQEYAEELARTRTRTAATKMAGDEATRRASAAQEWETARTTAVADLNKLHEKLKAEPGFAAKYKILVPTLKPVMARTHPSHWVAIFEAAYKDLKIETPVAVTPPAGGNGAAPNGGTPPAKTPQPMRANKQPPGQSGAQPKSALDAMSMALDAMKG